MIKAKIEKREHIKDNKVNLLFALAVANLCVQNFLAEIDLPGNYSLFLEAGVIILALCIIYFAARVLLKERRRPNLYITLTILFSLGVIIKDIIWIYMYIGIIQALSL